MSSRTLKGSRNTRGVSLWFCQPWLPSFFGTVHQGAERPPGPPGCPRRGLGRVRDRVPHDRVDDVEPFPGNGLQRLVVPHPPRPSGVVVPSEPVVRADEGVAAEYQQVVELLVAAALRRRRPDAGPGPAVRRRDAAFEQNVHLLLSRVRTGCTHPFFERSSLNEGVPGTR